MNAFAALVLLGIAMGFCAVQLLSSWSGGNQRTNWPANLAGNGLILAFRLSALFPGFESCYRFVCDRTDAMANTLVSKAWYARRLRMSPAGPRDDLNCPNALTPGRRRATFVGESRTAGCG